ncbi:DNA polymerase IV [Weeksella virosa]|uniref:DNA polymerase IV n=1 Tax=Weeksella virosa (strain ATCC 43766 / DSM 16922 / JCM 21250 / CCUG 30538 / CDC 9751 / IAM 14551 / NBRC 16016 / NCTC 11634 / CL345/78) TaxID=865938 RepID=F0P0C4_WEEVC|nr:DNA polymerase IV [Weeksella virosa]ADX68484.1 DNA polymerase IV [Weeksella virosa DSM 16922]MDK7375454.1 DNA polymerase IV [Weeksella virosa]MDK7675345.1 DNA polymerase IV [Weeksella virosa]SUP54818.1 DNA polymerase IV [Weeksella virosa]VEH63859.1 DNA polymerase IV [Weeksella virosa]
MTRKIIHIDMDAFYASVEQRDHPELRGKCIAVGSSSDRGVVATASYEARRYGVRSAMPSAVAKRKCPQLIFVKGNFAAYKEVSNQIKEIFAEYTDLIEPLSLDEAYLDVTHNHPNIEYATTIAKEIKQKIKETTKLTASAGVSFNKFLAKIASDYRKPDGLFVITPKMAEKFVEELPIEKFYGIGKQTAQRMRMMNIETGKDLKKLSLEKILREFGKSGLYYYNIARAIDHREVKSHRIRKSIGTENTFVTDLNDLQELKKRLIPMIEEVWMWTVKNQTYGRTITLKMKFNDFQVSTKSKTFLFSIQDAQLFKQAALELLQEAYTPFRPVRLIGISLSNLDHNKLYGEQLRIEFPQD